MKKFVTVLLVFVLGIGILAPLSAFADEQENKYNIVRYSKQMFIRDRDQYENDYSHPKRIEEVQKTYNNPYYTGKYDARLHLGNAMCDHAQYFDTNLTERNRDDAAKLQIACSAWRDKKYPHALVYSGDKSQGYYSNASFITYIGSKDYHFSHDEQENIFTFKNIEQSEYKNFIIVDVSIYPNRCYNNSQTNENMCHPSTSSVQISVSTYYNYYLMGLRNGYQYVAVFNTFTIDYPEHFNDIDKPRTEPEIDPNQNQTFHPYFTYTVKNKNLNGIIIGAYDSGDSIGEWAVDGRIKPVFELYDEQRENQFFKYEGSTLVDAFNYDFENYGVYYVKTYVLTSFPGMLHPDYMPKIIQPIWTKIVINGSTYVAITDPANPKDCKDNICEQTAQAESCSLIDDFNLRFNCESTRFTRSVRKQFGILFIPVDMTGRFINNFQTKTAISCSVHINQLNIDACVFQRKFPPLYTFLNMVANGTLLFAFILFLRSSLVGFLNAKGDE
ncbi:MAG: hypothetical protein Q4A27_00395 [bacterium]|nr:hypothetical protein [bacterium]